jgi:hypothetical protein
MRNIILLNCYFRDSLLGESASDGINTLCVHYTVTAALNGTWD